VSRDPLTVAFVLLAAVMSATTIALVIALMFLALGR
jgi:hypothetical protein